MITGSSANSTNAGLNISTEHRTMSCKKSSYVRRKLLYNAHSCPKLRSIWPFLLSFFYEHFDRTFNYAVFFIFKTANFV